MVETNAFGAFGVVLAEYGLQDRVEEINLTAARLAREAADEAAAAAATAGPAGWRATSAPAPASPPWARSPTSSCATPTRSRPPRSLAGGVDLLIVETVYDLLQAKAAINAAKRAMVAAGRRVPHPGPGDHRAHGPDAPGHRDRRRAHRPRPHAPRRHRAQLRHRPGRDGRGHPLPVASTRACRSSAQPNAGLPSVVDGKMHYDLTPDQLADHLERFITELGVSVVGGCCGTTPDHLRAVVERCRDLVPAPARHGDRARARGVVDLQQRRVPPGHLVPGGGRAHQRQRVEEVPRGHAGGRLGHHRGHRRATR